MLPWPAQLELAKAIWTYPQVAAELKPLLRPSHFSNPALGLLTHLLLTLPRGEAPPTAGQVAVELEKQESHIRRACLSLLPDVEKAACPTAAWAGKAGRQHACAQEAVILAKMLPALAEQGLYHEIRLRTEDCLRIAEQAQTGSDLVTVKMSAVTSERTQWMWDGFLPFGKVVILDGHPGLGKSTLLLDLAARLTTGRSAPFCDRKVSAASVAILSAEDSVSETIRPRLEAAGADLDRCHVIQAVKENDDERGFVVLNDAARLEGLVADMGVRLVIVDPLVAYLGVADFNSDQDVRRVLRLLAGVAERRGAACVCVRHFNKSKDVPVINRGGGSIGLIGAARVGLCVARHPVEADETVLAVYKSNLSRFPSSVRFRHVDDPVSGVNKIEWIGPSHHTAEELLGGGQ